MENTQNFNQKEAESKEAGILLDDGVKFPVEKSWFLKLFSKKKYHTFIIKQPFGGCLLVHTKLALKINLDIKLIEENPHLAAKQMVKEHMSIAFRILAVHILRSRLMIKLFSGILGKYLMWHMEPSMMLRLVLLTESMNNYGDFTDSIKLLIATRLTAPNLIEKDQSLPA